MYSSDELFQRSRKGYFGFATREINTKITRVSTETVHHESTYVILFLTRHNDYINDDKNDDLYTPSPCLTRSVFVLLMTSQSIAYDVTMTRHLRRDHVNSSQVLKCFFFNRNTYIWQFVCSFLEGGRTEKHSSSSCPPKYKTQMHEYCKLSIYHGRIWHHIENSTKRKKTKYWYLTR